MADAWPNRQKKSKLRHPDKDTHRWPKLKSNNYLYKIKRKFWKSNNLQFRGRKSKYNHVEKTYKTENV